MKTHAKRKGIIFGSTHDKGVIVYECRNSAMKIIFLQTTILHFLTLKTIQIHIGINKNKKGISL